MAVPKFVSKFGDEVELNNVYDDILAGQKKSAQIRIDDGTSVVFIDVTSNDIDRLVETLYRIQKEL